MKTINTEVLVIGGGATGAGVLRDLAMRGFKATLVEKRDLSHGTTGRYHGLLHSGCRYVIKDPQAARECYEENRVLRKIMPHCIEDTGGFFVSTPWDDPAYIPQFIAGCHRAGIPIEEISPQQMLKEEPLLNPDISRCFRVPDASADSFMASEANVLSAIEYGAQALTYHEVTRLLLCPEKPGKPGGKVTGAICYDLERDEDIAIHADLVVNASGAWAGKIAALAGLVVQIRPGKGTMIAINHRIVNTVVNRCKMPADGDIIVPAHTVAVIGTTDEQVADPDRIAIEPWEIELMLSEGEKMIPGIRQMRLLRAWAGVRPLYQETETSASRNISRAYVLLDHEERDGVGGLITITSGKWTTYRRMAEATVDKVCQKLGVQRSCRTHQESLPQVEHEVASRIIAEGKRTKAPAPKFLTLGRRLEQIEEKKDFNGIVCECELATYEEIERAILKGNARTLDDIRRDTRLGKGPCQGGFCTLRAVGILHHLRQPPVEQINAALHDFLNERWKGVRPILWGQQLRQERLDELIYRVVLNARALPGSEGTRLRAQDYEPPRSTRERPVPSQREATQPLKGSGTSQPDRFSASTTKIELQATECDVVVLGAGLAGLMAAWRAALGGKTVKVISKGRSALYWGSGCIDVYGNAPAESRQVSKGLLSALLEKLPGNPDHPYVKAGIGTLEDAVIALRELSLQSGYPLRGSLEKNWLLPTALGTVRPTCLAPELMTAGEITERKPLLIVGFQGFMDFYPELIAANLRAQKISAQSLTLSLPLLLETRNLNALFLARRFDDPEFRQALIQELKSHLLKTKQLHPDLRIGFPAVIGFHEPYAAWESLQDGLGCRIFEIPGLPPSLPGIRLHQMLVKAIEAAGGSIFDGMQVVEAQTAQRKVNTVWSEAAARLVSHKAQYYVLATGGILGGGLTAAPNGRIDENIFHLPVHVPISSPGWFQPAFLHPSGHAVFRSGILTDAAFQPIDSKGQIIYENLFAAGSALAGIDPLLEFSQDGIALTTGYLVGERLAKL